MNEFRVLTYQTAAGRIPFREWLRELRDRVASASVRERIDRLARGLFGDRKSIRGGVCEVRIDVGQGYRVYYLRRGNEVIILCGGDKKSQDEDVKRAVWFAEDYRRRA